jgi:uncharacterized protein (TIGR02145 family)
MFRLFNCLLFSLVFLFGCDDELSVPRETVSIDGKVYETIIIGTQMWTADNYNGPGGLPYDEINSHPEYGKYYSMEELSLITLPEGWRIPTQDDYVTMAKALGIDVPNHGSQTDALRGLISKTEWNHVSGTNQSGFNAYPAGYIFGTAPPIDGDIAEFWTSEGVTLSIQEAGKELESLRIVLYKSDDSPEYKFNVRFVRDR